MSKSVFKLNTIRRPVGRLVSIQLSHLLRLGKWPFAQGYQPVAGEHPFPRAVTTDRRHADFSVHCLCSGLYPVAPLGAWPIGRHGVW